MTMDRPPWLVFPCSELYVRVTPGSPRAEVAVIGNPQGLASLACTFLWLESYSGDRTGWSVTSLPFVKCEDATWLAIVFTRERQHFQGNLVRTDKDRQYEWQIDSDQLRTVGLLLHNVATNADYLDYLEVNVGPESDARLRFDVLAKE